VFIEERTVDVHIRACAKALEPTLHDRLIDTVRARATGSASPEALLPPHPGDLGGAALAGLAVALAGGAAWDGGVFGLPAAMLAITCGTWRSSRAGSPTRCRKVPEGAAPGTHPHGAASPTSATACGREPAGSPNR